MSLRWRADGRLLCAAKHPEEPNDTYIDDKLHYQLSVIARIIMPDVEEKKSGLWYWICGEDSLLLAAKQVHQGYAGSL